MNICPNCKKTMSVINSTLERQVLKCYCKKGYYRIKVGVEYYTITQLQEEWPEIYDTLMDDRIIF